MSSKLVYNQRETTTLYTEYVTQKSNKSPKSNIYDKEH